MIQMLSIRGPIKSNRHGRFLEKEIKNDYLSTHTTMYLSTHACETYNIVRSEVSYVSTRRM